MTIRTRLTLLFTAVVSVLLLLFCVVIYFFAEYHRQQGFYKRLREEARTSVELLFGKETISPELFKLLDKNQMTVLHQEEIIIYDFQNKLRYESGTDYLNIDKSVLDQVRIEKEVRWREGQREIVGIYFVDSENRFVVFGSAVDKYGFLEVKNLALVLGLGWLFATLVVAAVGWVYAYRALSPLKKLIARVDDITVSRLDLRVDVTNQQDEIGQLAERFNRMLDRLEEAFQLQRAFVSNASHELRTPLTAIMGQIEVALMDDDPKEWQETLRSVLDDARQLNRLSNGLLALAKVGMDESAVKLIRIQLDEVFWQVRSELLQAYPHYTVKVDLTPFSDEKTHFVVLGNEPLLRIALINLLENGCKFSSDNTVSVRFETQPKTFEIHFFNQGTTIPADELPHIFKPFRRGTNARQIAGHGIGLSLTERIVRLHRGSIAVESEESRGTVFVLSLPQKI
jgi:signal transduction histidine kinase